MECYNEITSVSKQDLIVKYRVMAVSEVLNDEFHVTLALCYQNREAPELIIG